MFDWARMILVALGIWGYTPDYQITFSTLQETDWVGVLAYAELQGDPRIGYPITGCNIVFIEPRITPYSDLAQDIATHEVGHCIGMIDHLPEEYDGLMNPVLTRVGFTGYDRWWFWRFVKSAPFRNRVSVSRD